jgi:hypothetical protein
MFEEARHGATFASQLVQAFQFFVGQRRITGSEKLRGNFLNYFSYLLYLLELLNGLIPTEILNFYSDKDWAILV